MLGLGWVGFEYLGAAAGGGVPVFSARSSPAASERVRGLNASEYALSSRYGSPLYLGTGGRPVIEVGSTGVVRELTPL